MIVSRSTFLAPKIIRDLCAWSIAPILSLTIPPRRHWPCNEGHSRARFRSHLWVSCSPTYNPSHGRKRERDARPRATLLRLCTYIGEEREISPSYKTNDIRKFCRIESNRRFVLSTCDFDIFKKLENSNERKESMTGAYWFVSPIDSSINPYRKNRFNFRHSFD